MMREMKYCLLDWAFATCFQASQGNGGDGTLSPCLGLCYQLSDLAGYWGRWNAVSLSGPLLPAFRPSQDNGGDELLSPCLGLFYQLSDLAG